MPTQNPSSTGDEFYPRSSHFLALPMTTTAICSTTLNIARRYAAAGLCTIPILPDGTKGPAIPSWKSYQTQPPLPDELDDWFEDGQKRIASKRGQLCVGLQVL